MGNKHPSPINIICVGNETRILIEIVNKNIVKENALCESGKYEKHIRPRRL